MLLTVFAVAFNIGFDSCIQEGWLNLSGSLVPGRVEHYENFIAEVDEVVKVVFMQQVDDVAMVQVILHNTQHRRDDEE